MNPETPNPLVMFLTGLVMAIVGFGLIAWNFRWIRAAFVGPVPITLAELKGLENPATLSNPFVSVACDQFTETKLGIGSNRGGLDSAKTQFILLHVEDRLLLTQVPTSHSGSEFIGHLDVWYTPLLLRGVDAVKESIGPQDRERLLPYQFTTSYAYQTQMYSLLALGLIFGVLGLGILFLSLLKWRRGDPQAAPLHLHG